MRKMTTLFALLAALVVLTAQEEKPKVVEKPLIIRCGGTLANDEQPLYVVDGVPLADNKELEKIDPQDILKISILKEEAWVLYGSRGHNGVVIIQTKNGTNTLGHLSKCQTKTLPFKVYNIQNANWSVPQELYNTLQARVPSLRINSRNPFSISPSIQLRGKQVAIVIVDGIRYDASILNTIDPNTIECVKVAPSVAASNYLINTSITN